MPLLFVSSVPILCGLVFKQYIKTASHFQGRSTLHGTCTLAGYFDLLTIVFETNLFLENGNCFIVSGHVNLTQDLCTVGSFCPFDL